MASSKVLDTRLLDTELHFTYFLFGVSAKHFSDEVSTTVSQNDTTGSATLISEKQNKTKKMAKYRLTYGLFLGNMTSAPGST